MGPLCPTKGGSTLPFGGCCPGCCSPSSFLDGLVGKLRQEAGQVLPEISESELAWTTCGVRTSSCSMPRAGQGEKGQGSRQAEGWRSTGALVMRTSVPSSPGAMMLLLPSGRRSYSWLCHSVPLPMGPGGSPLCPRLWVLSRNFQAGGSGGCDDCGDAAPGGGGCRGLRGHPSRAEEFQDHLCRAPQ